ncbi:hypothetical protein QTP88_018395 [Uroleucon formosanum]
MAAKRSSHRAASLIYGDDGCETYGFRAPRGRQSGREKKLIREPAGSAQPGDHRGLSARVSRGPSSARADTPCYCRSARIRSESVYIPWLCYCGCAAEGPVRLTELINRLMFPR